MYGLCLFVLVRFGWQVGEWGLCGACTLGLGTGGGGYRNFQGIGVVIP